MSERGVEDTSAPIFNEIKISERGRKYDYRSAGFFAKATIGLGAINCILALCQIVALVGRWRFLRKASAHLFLSRQEMTAAAMQNDKLIKLLGISFLLTLTLTYVAGGLWIYRAACNVRAAGARGLENTPGWAVGWYFVPFASLFKPFSAMEEIWNASLSPERWKTRPTPDLLRWWWGLWLLSNVFGWVDNAIARGASSVPALVFAAQCQMANSALDIASAALFLTIVLQITRMQEGSSARASELAAAFS